MVSLSLSRSIAVAWASSVMLLCAITITVITLLNRRATVGIAKDFLLSQARDALLQTEEFFNSAAKDVIQMQEFFKNTSIKLPSKHSPEDLSWLEPWKRLTENAVLGSNSNAMFGLPDESFFKCRCYPRLSPSVMLTHMYSPAHQSSFPEHSQPVQVFISNHSIVPEDSTDWVDYKQPNYNASMFPAYNWAVNETNVGTTVRTAAWREIDLSVPLHAIKVVMGNLITSSGEFFGFHVIAVAFEKLHSFVAQIASESGMKAYIVDSSGRVLAASHVPVTTYERAISSPLPRGCPLPHPGSPDKVLCFFDVNNGTSFPLLREAYDKISSWESGKIEDMEGHFVTYYKVNNLISKGFDLGLFLFYPKSEIFGDIDKATVFAVAAAVCIGVFFALLAAFFTHLLLLPLKDLGLHMKRTAHLEDHNDPLMPSRMSEIQELQESFQMMNTQLYKLKFYMPHALLAVAPNPADNVSHYFDQSQGDSAQGADPHVGGVNVASLDAQSNSFVKRRCTVLLIETREVPDESSTLHKKVKALMQAISKPLQRWGGVVDTLNPRAIIISFNAHSACPMHEEYAIRCALQIKHKAPAGWSFVVDTAMNWVGTCSVEGLRSRVVLGESSDLCPRLATLASDVLDTRLIATERTVHAVTDKGQATQVDISRMMWNSATRERVLRIFSWHGREGTPKDNVTILKRAYAAASQMKVVEAQELLSQLPGKTFAVQELRGRLNFMEKAEGTRARNYFRCELLPWETFGTVKAQPSEPLSDEATDGEVEEEQPAVAELLSKKLAERRAATESSADPEDDGGLFGVYRFDHSEAVVEELPLEITDLRGTTWTRSTKSIGGGSSGSVFIALSPSGHFAAIKSIPLSTDVDTTVIANELSTFSSLQHENIVSYLSCALTASHFIMVMEYVPAGTLNSMLSKFRCLPLPLCRRFAADVLRGIDFLHTKNIVHCDIKPDNVLITIDGVCKIADFGSSTHFAASRSQSARDLRGTVAFMAPEVACGNAPLKASDVWSFGIMFFMMFSGGEHPFEMYRGTSVGSLRYLSALGAAKVGEPRPPPPSMTPDAYEAFRTAITFEWRQRPTAQQLLNLRFFQ